MACFCVGAWAFARYVTESRQRDLVIACAAMALVVFFRYEYTLFIGPLTLWALYMKHGTLLSRAYFRDLVLFGSVVVTLFAVPLLVLNQWIYGDWRTYGPGLFNQIYFPDRTGADESSTISGLVTAARSFLLPSYPLDIGQTARNVPRLTLMLTPVFTVAGLVGAIVLVKSQRTSALKFLPILLLAMYVILYRGSGNTWAADITEPTFKAAIVRYWLPLYTIIYFLAVYALVSIRPVFFKGAMALALLISGPVTVYAGFDGSLQASRETIETYATFGEQLTANTEPNALVYASLSDKRIVPSREVATWWNGDEFYDPQVVAASMARVVPTGRPVYLFRETEVDVKDLDAALSPYNLKTERVDGTRLYKIAPVTARTP
jgi:hypothetical protein